MVKTKRSEVFFISKIRSNVWPAWHLQSFWQRCEFCLTENCQIMKTPPEKTYKY